MGKIAGAISLAGERFEVRTSDASRRGGTHDGRPRPGRAEAPDKYVEFDGFVSNHAELRSRLETRGHRFKTASDAEVILGLFEEDDGGAFVEELEGDFAFAVVGEGEALLARDRFGVRPLYYVLLEGGSLFLFASEVKGLLEFDEFTPEIDEGKLTDLVVPTFPVGNGCFLRGVMSVRPGHTLRVRGSGGRLRLEEREYFRPSFEPDDSLELPAARERLAELLVEAVGTRLPAGTDAALALSGGMDSTVIALIARRHFSKHLTTFTIGSSAEDQDVRVAGATARRLGSEHHEFIIGFDDFLGAIPAFVGAMERPLLRVGTPFYLLCREAARKADICLAGGSADAVFGAGRDFLIDKRIKRQMARGLARAREHGLGLRDEVSAIVTDLCRGQSYEHYISNFTRLSLTDILHAGMPLYVMCSMSFGLEVRDPYMSRRLVDFTCRVPPSLKVDREQFIDKRLFRHAALSMFKSDVLDTVLCRKSGLADPFRGYGERFERLCESWVPDQYAAEHPFRAYFTDKSQLILFDLFKTIFVENRGRRPERIEMLEFIKERAEAPQSVRV